MKKLAILGSTGSIGTQTLDIVRANKDIDVVALSAGSNIALLEEQVREFSPKLVCVFEESLASELATKISDTDTKVVSGMEGLIKVASENDADIVLTAVVGMVGIRPTLAAIEAGKDIALANKETLVTAGHLVTEAVRRKGVKLLPVDSEHSAIFQCLQGNGGNKIDKILLTCSGGPFRGKTMEEMREMKAEDALKHPNWSMGKKITIDSSTLVNKGLEVMEAGWLFDVSLEDIQVVIQPGSIIHSMVQYEDGAIMAQLGTPDMKIPIQYALYYPERRFLEGDRLDLAKLATIPMADPDRKNFPALDLAYKAGITGGSLPTVYNAANEWSVAKFLKGEIKFLEITENIQRTMDAHKLISHPDLADILETESWVYRFLEG